MSGTGVVLSRYPILFTIHSFDGLYNLKEFRHVRFK